MKRETIDPRGFATIAIEPGNRGMASGPYGRSRGQEFGHRVDHLSPWLLGGLLLFVGCSSGTTPMVEVTGTVTFDGQPLDHGSIVFDSADGLAPPVMGGIEGGRYTVGVPEGEKVVRIDAVRTLERKDQYGSPITESFIPSAYNGESLLRMRVTPGATNTFDVAIDSSGHRKAP